MSHSTTTESERSLGTIIKDLTADLSLLFRSEIALFKLELKEAGTKLGSGAAFMAGAVFLALIGLAFLFVTITLGMIALGLPPWLSSLIVTVVLLAAAGVLAILGKKKLEQVDFIPSEAIDHIKSDFETLKADVARVKGR